MTQNDMNYHSKASMNHENLLRSLDEGVRVGRSSVKFDSEYRTKLQKVYNSPTKPKPSDSVVRP